MIEDFTVLIEEGNLAALLLAAGVTVFWGGIHLCAAPKKIKACWEVRGIFVDTCALLVNLNNGTEGVLFAAGSGLHALFMPGTAISGGLSILGFWVILGEMCEQLALLSTIEDRTRAIVTLSICCAIWAPLFVWGCCALKNNETPVGIGLAILNCTMLIIGIVAATEDVRNILLIVPEIPFALISCLLLLSDG